MLMSREMPDSDFPTTAGAFAYDGEGLGQGGVYVTKLNPTATALGYSAYLGVGTANGITVDGSGDAYVTGTTARGRLSHYHRRFPGDLPGRFCQRVECRRKCAGLFHLLERRHGKHDSHGYRD